MIVVTCADTLTYIYTLSNQQLLLPEELLHYLLIYVAVKIAADILCGSDDNNCTLPICHLVWCNASYKTII